MRSLVGVLVALAACTPSSSSQTVAIPSASVAASAAPSAGASAPAPGGRVVKATSCPPGPMTYLGFRGKGAPPVALLDEIRRRFPAAIVVEVADGVLGVVIAEPHSWEVRGRHEAAAAAVGWKGDVVDFPTVSADCSLAFHTPPPPRH